ncbi:hypothetical protein [Pelomonas cellulosilytica]|uniref:Uncharacterized protein n=1 Tax=Pelomonas cellulosilytica TaxID=2906762 RepID=A0ABS8XYD1_9BURK|nr:hypothetical protein [Pelomonas sp. P8]MCE4556685.1 hypothetical protein [Pelomonas sp. P8]
MSPNDDEAFLSAITRCDLPPADFGHLQHLWLAWLHLRRTTLPEAIERTCTDIDRFARHHGARDKFNRTLTEALVRLMAGRGATQATLDWAGFQHRNADLVRDAAGLLARHYSPTLLASAEARRQFQPPDRLPLPA